MAASSVFDPSSLLHLNQDYFEFFEFRIQKILGDGRFGKVFLGVHERYSDVERAVKIISIGESDLREKNTNYDKVVKQFYNEVSIGRDLDHVNVIRSTSGVVCPEYLAIAMEYCPLGTLANHLKTLTMESTSRFFSGLVSGVEYIHGNRIVHGDIKLQNIFVNAKGDAVLGDFGSSFRMPEGVKCVTNAASTMGYYTPEIVSHEKRVDPFKCDSYAVGVVLRCMIQRRRPEQEVDYLQELDKSCVDVKNRYLLTMLLCIDPLKRFSMLDVRRVLSQFTLERCAIELSVLQSRKRCLGDISNSGPSPKQKIN